MNNSIFRPSEERMQMPFLPCARLSRIHSEIRPFEYPCPFIDPATTGSRYTYIRQRQWAPTRFRRECIQ